MQGTDMTFAWPNGPLLASWGLSLALGGLLLRSHRAARAHGAARQHLARLARVAEGTGSAVIVTGLDGVIQWINDGFTRISGYTFEECVGRVPGKLLQGAATDSAEVARIGAALRARQTVSAELLNYHKSGRAYWVGMKIEPLLNDRGVVDGFMAIEADITERRDQRLYLELLTSRFNLATRAAQIGIYEWALDEERIWWNDVMYAVFGEQPESFEPTAETWLAHIHPEDRERVRLGNRHRADSAASVKLHYRVQRADGSLRYVESIGLITQSSDGCKRLAGVLMDVSERVAIEERERNLQHRLRDSAHKAGMAEIAVGVLHNVGNVLNSLGVACSTVRNELEAMRLSNLDQAVSRLRTHRADLAQFLSEDERGRALTDYLPALAAHILTRSRALGAELDTMDQLLQHLREILSAQQTLSRLGGRFEAVDLREVVESALLVQAADLRGIEIVRRCDALPSVVTDRHKLLQILVNLIGNARDAVRANDSVPGRILVRLHCEADRAVISVEDTGIGMTEAVLKGLWRFGFTTKPNGHGFGLHNSANAANELGAVLDADSEGPGRGSRFAIRLPLTGAAPSVEAVA